AHSVAVLSTAERQAGRGHRHGFQKCSTRQVSHAQQDTARSVLARRLPHAIADAAHRLDDSGAVAQLLAERTDDDVHNVAATGVAVSQDAFGKWAPHTG